jgi:hypothetical protein
MAKQLKAKVILRFVRRSAEFLEIKDIPNLKKRLRGIYVDDYPLDARIG